MILSLIVGITYSWSFFGGIDFSFLCLMATEGGGGKGTWGKLLDADSESPIDRNDPNYDSGEVIYFLKFSFNPLLIAMTLTVL